MSVETGDLGGALTALGGSPAPAPATSQPATPQSPPPPGQEVAQDPPENPLAGYMLAFKAQLLERKFKGETVRGYVKLVMDFIGFCGAQGWEFATIPTNGASTFLLEKVQQAKRSQGRQAIHLFCQLLRDNGVTVAHQEIPNSVVNAKKEKPVANEVLPNPPPAAMPSAALPPAPPPAAGPQPQMGATPMMPQPAPRVGPLPGVATYRIYKKVNPGEPGAAQAGSFALIGDFPAQDIADIDGFIRQYLVPRFGPFPGGMDTVYHVVSLAMNGGEIRNLARNVIVAAERMGGYGAPPQMGYGPTPYGQPPMGMGMGQPGPYGQPSPYGQQPMMPPGMSPEAAWVLQRHKEDADNYRRQLDELRKEIQGGSGKNDPMATFMILQKLSELERSRPDPFAAMGMMGGGMGGMPPPGMGMAPAWGQPALPPPMPVAPEASAMAEIAREATQAALQAAKPPPDPLALMIQLQQLQKGSDDGTRALFEMLREDRRAAQEEVRELRRTLNEMLNNKKSLAEQVGELVATKKMMVELGIAKDDREDDGSGDSLIGLLRDVVGNAGEVGKAMKEIVTGFKAPSASDLAGQHAARVAATAQRNGTTPGARQAIAPAANVSAEEAARAAEQRARQAQVDTTAKAEAAQSAAAREAVPTDVINITDELIKIPGDGDPTHEQPIIMGVISLIQALQSDPRPKVSNLGKKVHDLFKQADSYAALRNLISNTYVSMGAPAIAGDSTIVDKIALVLHKHYPTIFQQMEGAERVPTDWAAVWTPNAQGVIEGEREQQRVHATWLQKHGLAPAPTPAAQPEAPQPQPVAQPAPAPVQAPVQAQPELERKLPTQAAAAAPQPAPAAPKPDQFGDDAYGKLMRERAAANGTTPAPVVEEGEEEEEAEEEEEEEGDEEEGEEGEEEGGGEGGAEEGEDEAQAEG